jgi:putative tryptophan/tyrosine transport system substrate-binding protein
MLPGRGTMPGASKTGFACRRLRMARRTLLQAALPLLLAPHAIAQVRDSTAVPRIGVLAAGDLQQPPLAALLHGLIELGRVPGRDIRIEHTQSASMALLGDAAAELANGADVLVTWGVTATRAAMSATQSIPIVMVTGSDPVELGLVRSLARPGGNVTGIATLTQELVAKRLEILRQAAPVATRIAALYVEDSEANIRPLKMAVAVAQVLGAELVHAPVHRAMGFEAAFEAASRQGVTGLVILPGSTMSGNRALVVALATRHRLVAMYPDRTFVEAGGLMSYGPNYQAMFHRAAYYVDRLLKGAKPAAMPIEQPTRIELVVNLKAAAAIELTLPASIIDHADEAFE